MANEPCLKVLATVGSDGEFDKRGVPEAEMDKWHATLAEIDPATPEQIDIARTLAAELAKLGFTKKDTPAGAARIEIRVQDGDGRV